jgi:DNA-directed RNA polymerase specialized sigma24 family protein
MDLAALRRAFRARPGTAHSTDFANFLEGLEANESGWRSLVSLLEKDVIPVVLRCHPSSELDEIWSSCLTGAFESWVSEWLACFNTAAQVRELLEQGRHDDALAGLQDHPRFRGHRAEQARVLWGSRRWHDAVNLIEGTQSARSHFIARTRAQIRESQRKQRRQSRLMTRHCADTLGIATHGGPQAVATQAARSLCGAEIASTSGGHSTWRISAFPPAHLLSQELAERLRQMLGAIEELGPEHARVFKLLLEGLSQRSIAEVEGRHPAAISRRVRCLQELCRVQLLE